MTVFDPTRREAGPAGTRRETSPGAPTVREGSGDTSPGAAVRTWRLPSVLVSRYTLEREFDAVGTEADGFLIRGESGLVFAKVYRRGVTPDFTVLERLNASAPEHVIRLIETGFSEVDHCYYELLEYAEHGTLSDLVRNQRHSGALSRAWIRDVLVELHDAIRHVHSLGIEHRDIKPDNVLVRTPEPLDLVLTDFGISSAMDATRRFTARDRTVRYSPPESLSGVVHRTRWDYWSLGIILVELLTGRNPFDGKSEPVVNQQLISYPTDELVEGVTERPWRLLCRGLLRRDPQKRWNAKHVLLWLNNPDDPSLSVADEGGAHGEPSVPAFMFLGKAYRSTNELAGAFGANWNEALNLWKTAQPSLVRWIRHDLGETKLADLVELVDKSSAAGEHAQLFAVIRVMGPDVSPVFQGRPVSMSELRSAASAVGETNDGVARGWLLSLHRDSILPLLRSAGTEGAETAAVAEAWSGAIDEFQALGAATRVASGHVVDAPPLDEQSLGTLLAAATSGSRAIDGLRGRAAQAATGDARTRLWFRDLGEPGAASPAVALMMLLLAGVAAGEVDAARSARRASNNELWSNVGGGVVISAAGAGAYWGGVEAYCQQAPTALCSTYVGGRPDLATLVFLGAAVVAAVSLLWAVDAQTARR